MIDQLAGAAVPASALETLVLPGRMPGYQPAMLDELTAAGEVAWSGAGGLPGGDGWIVLAPADTAPLLFPPPGEISMTGVHEAILGALDGGGAMFFRMLADRAAALLPEQDRALASDAAVAAAIWDLVWAGRLSNDTLAALRTVLGTGRPVLGSLTGSSTGGASVPRPRLSARPGSRRRGFGRPAMPSRTGPPTVTGRWSLVPPADPDPTRRLHALARTLLDRHGILLRGTVAAERVPGGFAAIYPVLRAMEDAGQCRRGYFVEGLGAAQFALPGAVDRMRALAAESNAVPGRPIPGRSPSPGRSLPPGRSRPAGRRSRPGAPGRTAPSCWRQETRPTRSARGCPGRTGPGRRQVATGPGGRRGRSSCWPAATSCCTWNVAGRPCCPGRVTRRCWDRRPRRWPGPSGAAPWAG